MTIRRRPRPVSRVEIQHVRHFSQQSRRCDVSDTGDGRQEVSFLTKPPVLFQEVAYQPLDVLGLSIEIPKMLADARQHGLGQARDLFSLTFAGAYPSRSQNGAQAPAHFSEPAASSELASAIDRSLRATRHALRRFLASRSAHTLSAGSDLPRRLGDHRRADDMQEPSSTSSCFQASTYAGGFSILQRGVELREALHRIWKVLRQRLLAIAKKNGVERCRRDVDPENRFQ